MRRQRPQQLEFDVGELHRLAAHLDHPARDVDHEPVVLDQLVLALAERPRRPGAAEQGAHARAELADRERLRDVVVRAELEADHLVELVVAGRQHDDRHRARRAQPLAHLEPVEPRQHDVEHDEVDRRVGETAQRLLAVGRLHDRVPVLLEREREHLADGVLVVDEQDRGSRFGHRRSACCQDSPRYGDGPDPRTPSPRAPRLARTPGQRAPLPRLAPPARRCRSLILAFSITRPGALPAPLLPPNFDGAATRQLAADFVEPLPGPRARRAGVAERRAVVPRPARAVRPARLVRHLDGARARPRARPAAQPLGGRARAVVGRDRRHGAPRRHGRRAGGERRRERHRRAGRARARLRTGRHTGRASACAPRTRSSFSPPTAVPSAGSVRSASPSTRRSTSSRRSTSTAIAGHGPPRIVITGDSPRSPAASLVETAAKRVLEQTGTQARRTGPLGAADRPRLPVHALRAGAVRRARHSGRHPDDRAASGRRQRSPTGRRRSTRPGWRRSAAPTQELIGSLDQGLELAQGTTSFVWIGDRIVRGWAIELFLVALLIPYLVAVVDLFAHCRRRRIPLLPAARSLRTRLALLALPRARVLRRSARSARGRPACRGRRTRLLPHQATGRCSR